MRVFDSGTACTTRWPRWLCIALLMRRCPEKGVSVPVRFIHVTFIIFLIRVNVHVMCSNSYDLHMFRVALAIDCVSHGRVPRLEPRPADNKS